MMPYEVDVGGSVVRGTVKGDGRDTVLLLHGRGAHRRWWHAVTPALDGMRVVDLDLSGHGDSDHRDEYSAVGWVSEVGAVLRHLHLGPVTVVGHSMGGRVALGLAATNPGAVERLVLLDVAVGDVRVAPMRRRAPKRSRVHPTREAALNAFRLLPAQPAPDATTLRAVAEYGVREVEGGWTWKFDPRVLAGQIDHYLVNDWAHTVECELWYAYGTESAVATPEMADFLAEASGREVPCRAIAGAGHHVTLDDPASCADFIRTALASGASHAACDSSNYINQYI